MKAISLKRLKDNEAKLEQDFPNIDFKFTKGSREIEESDKQEVDILFGYDDTIDEDFVKACPNLKWIAWYATGVNNLPLKYMKENDIRLTNGRGIHAKQMSEFIVAYILDDYKKMYQSFINQQNNVYDSRLTGARLAGETVLFLGTGKIAQKTARILDVMGVRLIGVNTTGHEADYFEQTYSIDALDEALPKADIIINTLPETEQTYHLLDQSHFEKMKDSSLFINVGRGTIVDENILIHVLNNQLIRHATLDVFENEPLEASHPFYEMDNVTITAHITGNGIENYDEATEIFKRNLESFLNKNELIENVVDPNRGY